MSDNATLLASLKAARYSGVRRVRHGDRDITYGTDAELESAIRALEAETEPKRAVFYVTPALRRD